MNEDRHTQLMFLLAAATGILAIAASFGVRGIGVALCIISNVCLVIGFKYIRPPRP